MKRGGETTTLRCTLPLNRQPKKKSPIEELFDLKQRKLADEFCVKEESELKVIDDLADNKQQDNILASFRSLL